MRYLILAPAVAVMILTFASQMLTLAESTQAKTIAYAESMNDALDCAYKGVDLRICSPDLYDYEFSSEIEETVAAAESYAGSYDSINLNRSGLTLTELISVMDSYEIIYLNQTAEGDIIALLGQ